MASVVFFLGIKAYCCLLIISSLLNLDDLAHQLSVVTAALHITVALEIFWQTKFLNAVLKETVSVSPNPFVTQFTLSWTLMYLCSTPHSLL